MKIKGRASVIFSLLLILPGHASATVASAEEKPFDYFYNSWNWVGLRNYRYLARVTPDNAILLEGKNQLQFKYGQNPKSNLERISRRHTKTALEGWLPVLMFSAVDGPLRYEFKYWATPLPTVQDWRKAFDWPTEGENFLVWALVTVTNTGSKAVEAKLLVDQSDGTASKVRVHSWQLAPASAAEVAVRVPFKAVDDPAAFDKEDARVWLERTATHWKDLLAGGAKIEVPSRKATEALLAAHICQLLTSDQGELRGGKGFYEEFYIRDGAYQIMELEEAGLTNVTAKAIESFLRHQRPDGRFESQRNELDANGQALWALWQYGKITGDRAWLEKAYPQMRKAADWTMKARRETPADSPYAGLLPAAPADGEHLWDGKHHIVGYDLWNLRGLLCAADAARILGKAAEAGELEREAGAYRNAIDAAFKKLDGACFPPSWEKEGTDWGNTETLWPTPLFAPDDPRVGAMIQELRQRHGGGYVEGTIRWVDTSLPEAILPYMGAYTTMAEMLRGNDRQVVEDFHWYLLHSTAAHAFAEGIFYQWRVGWHDRLPHVTGAANYALMLRHMLIFEAGDELHLLMAVPDWWLSDRQQIRIEHAPTQFGEMSLLVRGTKDGVEIKLDPPKREPPGKIVVCLPQSRPLAGPLDGVKVVTRADQKQRWDFPAVVDLYRNLKRP